MPLMYIRTRTFFIYLILFAGLITFSSCSKNTDLSDLVKRKGIVYKKTTNELFSGMAVSYYEKSKENKKALTEYKNGLIDGPGTTWYKTGEMKARKNFIKDRLHGETIMWYINGQKKSVETFVKGKQSGRQRYWKKDGSLIKDRIFN